MDTLLKIITALSFSGAATLVVWILVEAANEALRPIDYDEDDDDLGFGA